MLSFRLTQEKDSFFATNFPSIWDVLDCFFSVYYYRFVEDSRSHKQKKSTQKVKNRIEEKRVAKRQGNILWFSVRIFLWDQMSTHIKIKSYGTKRTGNRIKIHKKAAHIHRASLPSGGTIWMARNVIVDRKNVERIKNKKRCEGREKFYKSEMRHCDGLHGRFFPSRHDCSRLH